MEINVAEIKTLFEKLRKDLTEERIGYAKAVAHNPADPNLGAQISRIRNIKDALTGLDNVLSDNAGRWEMVEE